MRRSGPESTSTVFPPARTTADDLNRLFRKSSEVQTAQLQPITGTPTEVPVPKNVKEKSATRGILNRLQADRECLSRSLQRSWHFTPKSGVAFHKSLIDDAYNPKRAAAAVPSQGPDLVDY